MTWTEVFTDYTLRNVALGSAILGVVSGVLGSFAVLRRQGLAGDALAHAALPGICLAYLATGSKAAPVLMLGAALAGWAGMAILIGFLRRTRVDPGSALAIVLTTFFGFGVVLLTVVQKRPDASQAGLDKFLFGQAATLVQDQVVLMAGLAAIVLALVAVLFKEFKVFVFDVDYARTLGLPTGRLGALLTALLVVAIVIGLNTVGVVLMSAMLVAPAAAARQWTESLGRMILLAAGFGAGAGIFGALWSVSQDHTPTGPAIVLILSLFVVVSLLFGSSRGWVWERLRRHRHHEVEA
jgi:manganese/zinc/iron transport system permease protein